MSDPYPKTFQDVAAWAMRTAIPIQDARIRFAQFVILGGIASEPSLRNNLVFKGGNALDFVLQPNRSTIDLDFSLDMTTGAGLADAEALRAEISLGLSRVAPMYGCGLAVHSVRQNPRGSGRSFVTYQARIGYALPDERHLLIRMANNRLSPHVMPIEISINEPIFDSATFVIDQRFSELRISTLADIVGEKLRALLQQSIRNRHRRQDVLDLAVAIRMNPLLDRDQVASALVLKAKAQRASLAGSIQNRRACRPGRTGLCGAGGHDANHVHPLR